MRVGILTLTQPDSARPSIWTSATEARHYLATGSHSQVGTGKLRKLRENFDRATMTCGERAYRRPAFGDRVKFVPVLCEPGPDENLDLAYPAPLMTSVTHRHPGMLLACKEAKKRKEEANV